MSDALSPPAADHLKSLDPMSLDGFERLHPSARLNWILGALIGVGVLTLAGAVFEFVYARKQPSWPWPPLVPVISLVSGAVLAVMSSVLAAMRFARFGYRLRERDLVVQSGVIWRSRRCIPRARVQHVAIDNGPLDRAFGLVDVELFVAGGMGAVARIPGVTPEAAEQLREALIVERTDGV